MSGARKWRWSRARGGPSTRRGGRPDGPGRRAVILRRAGGSVPGRRRGRPAVGPGDRRRGDRRHERLPLRVDPATERSSPRVCGVAPTTVSVRAQSTVHDVDVVETAGDRVRRRCRPLSVSMSLAPIMHIMSTRPERKRSSTPSRPLDLAGSTPRGPARRSRRSAGPGDEDEASLCRLTMSPTTARGLFLDVHLPRGPGDPHAQQRHSDDRHARPRAHGALLHRPHRRHGDHPGARRGSDVLPRPADRRLRARPRRRRNCRGRSCRPGAAQPRSAHVDAALAQVESLGGQAPARANDMPWGQRVAHVKDPDGNAANPTTTSA